jgi:pantoate--beta-alanine ligase
MEQYDTIDSLRIRLDGDRRIGRTVGVVPTMGALHEGHASLIQAAVMAGHATIVTTIFVNPLQFGQNEDLAAYPRDLDGDRAIARDAGANVLFAPSVVEMYPFGARNVLTNVSVRQVTDVLDGLARPGHFDGVATVVSKLFNIVGPCHAYFGEKDFQQLAVVRRLAVDLSCPVEIVGCPTVREANGLARSSRNRYLTAQERERASVIYEALLEAAARIAAGERSVDRACAVMRSKLASEPIVAAIDYVACVDPLTLREPDVIDGPVRLLVAVRVGNARLIDNVAAGPLR